METRTDLAKLVCKGCDRVLAKVFAEEPRVAGLAAPKRTCRACAAAKAVVRYDPAADVGVRP